MSFYSSDLLDELMKKPNREWMRSANHRLITKIEDWEEWKTDTPTNIVLDLETSGLNKDTCIIAGFGFSKKPGEGIYVPLNHKVGINFEDKDYFIKDFNVFAQSKSFIMHNSKFDVGFLESNGYFIPKFGKNFLESSKSGTKLPIYQDSMISVYLHNPNEKNKGLKGSSARFLGLEMINLDELFPPKTKELDFTTLDSTEPAVFIYGCSDCDITYRIFDVLEPVRKEQPFIYEMETRLLEVVRHMEDNRMLLDSDYLARIPLKLKADIINLLERIYEDVGYEFDIMSPKQVAEALIHKGVQLSKTEKGNWETSAKALTKLNDPLSNSILEYRSLLKFLNTYILQLYKESLKGRVKFRFNQMAAPTGRFSSGQDGTEGGGGSTKVVDDGYAPINVQSIPSNKAAVWIPVVRINKRYMKDTGDLVYEEKPASISPEDIAMLEELGKKEKLKKKEKPKK